MTAMDVVYALKRQGRILYGFEEIGFVGVGLWVLLVREKWFWRREMDLWVLRERKRDLGVGAAIEDGGKKKGDDGKKKWRKLGFDCVW